jgi:FKBP-type peptidyl-prolyl cis-trans isomerase SlyD
MKVGKGAVVGLDYKLHLGDGKVVDESLPGDPLFYLHGGGQIVPGLETALEGMEVGQSKQVVVAAKEGYGEHDARGVQEVPRSQFPPGVEPQAGMQFVAHDEDGEAMPIAVREVRGDTIVIDLNHPLAGKTLHFDVKVTEVRAATAEEMAHGHAHGEGDHDH